MKSFNVKPVINKRNNQINISIPKKNLSKRQILDIKEKKMLKIKIEDIL